MFFFVNKLPFYLSKSARINFLGVKRIGSRKASELSAALNNDVNKYTSRGLNISDIHSDNEFDVESIKNEMMPINRHFYAKEEHVGIVENAIKKLRSERDACVTRRRTSGLQD